MREKNNSKILKNYLEQYMLWSGDVWLGKKSLLYKEDCDLNSINIIGLQLCKSYCGILYALNHFLTIMF